MYCFCLRKAELENKNVREWKRIANQTNLQGVNPKCCIRIYTGKSQWSFEVSTSSWSGSQSRESCCVSVYRFNLDWPRLELSIRVMSFGWPRSPQTPSIFAGTSTPTPSRTPTASSTKSSTCTGGCSPPFRVQKVLALVLWRIVASWRVKRRVFWQPTPPQPPTPAQPSWAGNYTKEMVKMICLRFGADIQFVCITKKFCVIWRRLTATSTMRATVSASTTATSTNTRTPSISGTPTDTHTASSVRRSHSALFWKLFW